MEEKGRTTFERLIWRDRAIFLEEEDYYVTRAYLEHIFRQTKYHGFFLVTFRERLENLYQRICQGFLEEVVFFWIVYLFLEY